MTSQFLHGIKDKDARYRRNRKLLSRHKIPRGVIASEENMQRAEGKQILKSGAG